MDQNTDQNASQVDNAEGQKEMSREFVEKVLKEKRNTVAKNQELNQELEVLRLKLQDLEEKELLKERKFEELFKQKAQEVDQWKNKYTEQEKTIINATKIGALKTELTKMGINQERLPHVMRLVDLEKIQYDNESRTVLGVEDISRDLSQSLPEWFGTSKVGVNQDASNRPPAPLTMEKWKELPDSERNKPEVISRLRETLGIPYKR